MTFPSRFPLLFLPLFLAAPVQAAFDGAALYQAHCAICHGVEGRGIPGVFPPLADSDFLTKERVRAIRAPLEGLSGKITVNGQAYEGAMPPVALDDAQTASVLTHVFSAWGNTGEAVSPAEVAEVRSKTKYPTHARLLAALGGGVLPAAPEGWTLSVGAELSFSPLRLVAHPDGASVLVGSQAGDVRLWKPGGNGVTVLFKAGDYLDFSRGEVSVYGMNTDRRGRLYLVCNQRNEKVSPVRNEVTVYRTEPWTAAGGWTKPKPWLKTGYPWGVGPYNHGVNHVAQGPDGMIYINSGSRTDGGEAGTNPNYATTGEDPLTACLWRVDPEAETPEIKVHARGLRNSFAFCWDGEGRLLAVENGPDADAPEELNWIEPGRHYGFPYQFSDWDSKAYEHTPDAPAGFTATRPLRNLGPDGGGKPEGLSTFDPHSCPSGIVWLEPDWPAPLGGSLIVTRFGNLIRKESGYDVLQLRPDFTARTTTVKTLLAPLGRPIAVLKLSGHRLVIAEFCRGTNLAAGLGTPGRLLLLEPKAK